MAGAVALLCQTYEGTGFFAFLPQVRDVAVHNGCCVARVYPITAASSLFFALLHAQLTMKSVVKGCVKQFPRSSVGGFLSGHKAIVARFCERLPFGSTLNSPPLRPTFGPFWPFFPTHETTGGTTETRQTAAQKTQKERQRDKHANIHKQISHID